MIEQWKHSQGFDMEKERLSDIELLEAAKSIDPVVSSNAQLALWERYEFFIKKKYYQWINTFQKERVDFDDYMQEAYLAMVHAIELADIDRMKQKGASNFSTVFYFQLMKIKNRYDIHYEKYGEVLTCSDMSFDEDDTIENRFHGSNSVASKWVSALTIDCDQERLNAMSERLVREYTQSLDAVNQKICQLLIEREKVSTIVDKLRSIMSEDQIKQKIKEVKLGLKTYVEENAYA